MSSLGRNYSPPQERQTASAGQEHFDAAILTWATELAPQGVFTTDKDLRIRTWNLWLEHQTHLVAAQVLGKPLVEVIPSLRERRLDHYYRDALNGESKLLSRSLHGYLLPVRRAGASPGFAYMQQSARISPLLLDGAIIGTVTTIEDVTEREWQSSVLRLSRLRSELLAETLAKLMLARDPDDLIGRLFTQISPALHLDCCIHHLLEPQSQRMKLHWSTGLSQDQEEQFAMMQVGQGLCGTVLRTREQLVINRLQENNDSASQPCRSFGLQAFAGFPLLVGSRLLGSLAFGTRTHDSFSDDDVRFLYTVSQYAAVALDRTQQEILLRSSEERFRHMADTVPDITFTAAPDGSRDYMNSRFTEITGMPGDTGLGFGWMKALDPEDAQRVQQHWFGCGQVDGTYSIEYRIRTRDGRARWFYERARPILDDHNRVTKWFGAVTDIHELKITHEELSQAQAELARRAASLEVAVQDRTRQLKDTISQLESFSYTVAHDLRAPIRSLESFSNILLEDYAQALPGEARTLLANMARAARRLDHLTKDVLTYTRVSTQKTELAPVDPEEVVQDLMVMNPALQAPEAVVAIVRPLHRVLGNRTMLSQCLSNLLSNAVKFIKPGSVPHIVISSELLRNPPPGASGEPAPPLTTQLHHSRSDEVVRISVQDNGIGMEPEALNKIFGIFERGRGVSDIPGTGIGLAILARSVQRMGGTYGVESQLGEGSRFWIELPPG